MASSYPVNWYKSGAQRTMPFTTRIALSRFVTEAARFAVTVLTHGLDCLRSEARRIISPVATEQSWMTPTKFRKTAVVPVRCDPFASGFDCKGCEVRIGGKVDSRFIGCPSGAPRKIAAGGRP